MTHQSGYTHTEWAGTLHSVRPAFIKKVTTALFRQRLILAHLKKKGRIKYNKGGESLTWAVDYLLPQPQTHGDANRLTFPRRDYVTHASVGFRQYVVTDAISWQNKQQNKGPDKIVDLVAQRLDKIGKSMTQYFNGQLYVDGYASGNEQRIHGLQSFTGRGTCAAGDKIAQPSDTYAEIPTTLNAAGNVTWSTDLATSPNSTIATDWPFGSGANGQLDSSYDYWSPKLWNYSSTAWETGETTWEANCLKVIRNAMEVQDRLVGSDGKPDLFLADSPMIIGLKDALEPRMRIEGMHKPSADLGFPSVPQYEGAGLSTDYNIPGNRGFGIPVDQMEICTQHDGLFYIPQPEFNLVEDADLFVGRFLGQARYETPRSFFEIGNYA